MIWGTKSRGRGIVGGGSPKIKDTRLTEPGHEYRKQGRQDKWGPGKQEYYVIPGEHEADPWADPSKQHEREWCKARGRFNKTKINKCKLSETRGKKNEGFGNGGKTEIKIVLGVSGAGGECLRRVELVSRGREFTGAGTGIRGLRNRGRNAD